MVASPRILVADDQTDILQALRLLLGDAGFDTDLVSSADAVRASLGRIAYDLLLMDLNYTRDTTSGREGLELLDDVRARDAALPVVVMTGWGSIDTAVEAMRRGARGYLPKPWDNDALIEIVRREVDEGRAARRAEAHATREWTDARAIQQALLPKSSPFIPGFAVSGLSIPAGAVGGDWYDFISFDDGCWGLVLADVSGKGTAAALLMSATRGMLRSLAQTCSGPGEVLTRLNRLLVEDFPSGKFVTMLLAVLNPTTRELTFSSAGHLRPLLVDEQGARFLDSERGMPLGLGTGEFSESRVQLSKGSRLVFYSDGITEATGLSDEEYGAERMRDHVLQPEASAESILADVRVFANGQGLQDDATVIFVRA